MIKNSHEDQVDRFSKRAHIRYSLRNLRILPSPYESDDGNRMMFGFFCINSLALLKSLDQLDEKDDDESDRKHFIDWIYDKWDDRGGGFRGGSKLDHRELEPDELALDQPHLAHTYTALLILASLSLPTPKNPERKSPYNNLNVSKLIQFVKNCQRPDGSFSCSPKSPDHDVRFVYCALAILYILRVNPNEVIDVESVVEFLKSCRRYEGGYGQGPFNEAQGGTTYCAIASLAFIQRLETDLTDDEAEETFRWLTDRQSEYLKPNNDDAADDDDDAGDDDKNNEKNGKRNKDNEKGTSAEVESQHLNESTNVDGPERFIAGFQGRIGKPLDTCYSFWCMGALKILSTRKRRRGLPKGENAEKNLQNDEDQSTIDGTDMKIYCDPRANIEFLLECQSTQYGGICKNQDSLPDVYHSYLSLASLSLSFSWAIENELKNIKSEENSTIETTSEEQEEIKGGDEDEDEKRKKRKIDISEILKSPLEEHDPLLNVPVKVSEWARKCFLKNF